MPADVYDRVARAYRKPVQLILAQSDAGKRHVAVYNLVQKSVGAYCDVVGTWCAMGEPMFGKPKYHPCFRRPMYERTEKEINQRRE